MNAKHDIKAREDLPQAPRGSLLCHRPEGTWLLLADQPEATFIIRNSKTGLFFLKEDKGTSLGCLWQGSRRQA